MSKRRGSNPHPPGWEPGAPPVAPRLPDDQLSEVASGAFQVFVRLCKMGGMSPGETAGSAMAGAVILLHLNGITREQFLGGAALIWDAEAGLYLLAGEGKEP